MSLDKMNHVHQEHVRVLCKANLSETRGRATKEQSKGTPRERTMKTVQWHQLCKKQVELRAQRPPFIHPDLPVSISDRSHIPVRTVIEEEEEAFTGASSRLPECKPVADTLGVTDVCKQMKLSACKTAESIRAHQPHVQTAAGSDSTYCQRTFPRNEQKSECKC